MFIICVGLPALAGAQDTISLEQCLNAARDNHPRQADYQLLENVSENKLENYGSHWYPELNLNGSATYQSDVIRLNIDSPIPGLEFPVPPKDQYKVTVDVSQTIYDAGVTKKQKEVEMADVQATVKQLKSDIEKEKDGVKNLYYSILILQENRKITTLSMNQLDTSMRVVRSGVDHGVLLSSDLDLMRVEAMKLEQNMSELENRRQALIKILSVKTGLKISGKDSLILTVFSTPGTTELQRTELEVFDLKKEVIGKSADLLNSKRLPVLFAFGQFGYGKPGLNLLNDKFDNFYFVGAGLKWNIWDWNQVKRDKENLQMQSAMISHQKEYFEMNLGDALIQQMAEINTHHENIGKFEEILSLRENITATYHTQLSNGTIKTSDFLEVLNAEKIARIRLATEKILLQKAIAEYKYTEGTL